MSWDKNTVINSEIDTVARTLDDLNIPYELITLGNVVGHGLNDDYSEEGPSKTHPIRMLTYKDRWGDVCIREQMQRFADCDADDVIVSVRFQDKRVLPKEFAVDFTQFPLEVYYDEEGERIKS
jgi:hypothetical protein